MTDREARRAAIAGELGAELRRVLAEEPHDRAFAHAVLREIERFAALRLWRGYPAPALARVLRRALREHRAVGAAPADLRGYVCGLLEREVPRPHVTHWRRAGVGIDELLPAGDTRRKRLARAGAPRSRGGP